MRRALRTRQLRVLLAALLTLAPLAAHGQPAAGKDFLALLTGGWDMRGNLRGRSAHYHAAGRWVLDGAWLEFAMRDVATPPAYAARLFIGYDDGEHDFIAHWLDRFGAAGARVVATGTLTGHTLVLSFPYPAGTFRDTLTLVGDSAGTLLIESQQPDGSWSTFARYELQRLGKARTRAGPARSE